MASSSTDQRRRPTKRRRETSPEATPEAHPVVSAQSQPVGRVNIDSVQIIRGHWTKDGKYSKYDENLKDAVGILSSLEKKYPDVGVELILPDGPMQDACPGVRTHEHMD